MNIPLLTSRFLSEYTRRPLNLARLAVVPVIFVVMAAQPIADFAELLGGAGGAGQRAALTASWAAAFLAGVSGYFHSLSSRSADRRLAAHGMGAGRIVTARLFSGLLLATAASVGSVAALWFRTGIEDPLKTAAVTLTFAVLYLAIGTAIGASVKNQVNGSLIVVFVWMLDVFLGPGVAGGDNWVTRLFPNHFPTFVAIGSDSEHAGALGDVVASVLWVVGSLMVASIVFIRQTRSRALAAPSVRILRDSRLAAGLSAAFREQRRNTALWLLLFLLPIGLITLSFAVTPDIPAPVDLPEGENHTIQNIMFSAAPPAWGGILPAHGPVRVLVDSAFTPGFDTGAALLLGLGWMAALGIAAGLAFHRLTRGAT